MNVESRNIDDVNDILSFAKLSKSDLLLTSQALFFSPSNIQVNSFQLLELNNELLKNVENNEKLCIKGCDNDDLVICSETSTFHIRSAETSNNLLLVAPEHCFDHIKENDQEKVETVKVDGIFQVYLEASIGKCLLSRLFEVLSKSVYKGQEHESDVDETQLFTLAELKNIVQASDAELIDALNSMDICEIRGKIREIDFEYHFRVLSYMLKLIDENSWSLDTIDYNETCDSLKHFIPEEVIKSLFNKYTTLSKMLDGVQLYKYKEADVCQFFARVILRTAEKFNLDEFLQAWRESVPEGMIPNDDMLHGIAIINRKASPKVIWAFEESSLPDDITERFKKLFEAKEKWTVPEIAPYIRRLATNKLDVNALLAKHARASKVDEVKYYSAKHLK